MRSFHGIDAVATFSILNYTIALKNVLLLSTDDMLLTQHVKGIRKDENPMKIAVVT